MAHMLYVGNAPKVAQVNRLMIEAGQYENHTIAEGSRLIATINEKSIEAMAPIREEDVTAIEGPYVPLEDYDAAGGLLKNFYDVWRACVEPEFREITCSKPAQDDNGDWYVDLTAVTPGMPFHVDIYAPYPVVDIDTLRNGAPGLDAEFTFTISDVAESGTFRIQWEIDGSVQMSGPIAYPPTAESIFAACAVGMAGVTADTMEVTGTGTEADPWKIKLKGLLGSTATGTPNIITSNLTGGGQVFTGTLRDGNSGTVSDTFTRNYLNPGYKLTAAYGGYAAHVADTGETWAGSSGASDCAWTLGSGLTVKSRWPGAGYGISEVDFNVFNSYAGVKDATVGIQVYDLGVQQHALGFDGASSGSNASYNDPFYGTADTLSTGQQANGFIPLTLKLHSNYASDTNQIWAEFLFDPFDDGGRAARSTTSGATGYTGTVTITVKKAVGGTITTIATDTVDRNLLPWKCLGGASYTYDFVGAVLPETAMSLSLATAGGNAVATLVDTTYTVTTTVTGSLAGTVPSVSKYGMSFYAQKRNEINTTISYYWQWQFVLDNFTVTDASDPDERQKMWVSDGAAGGTFYATYGGDDTTSITFPPTRAALQAKLEEVVGAGNIQVVSGNGVPADPWVLRYIGALAATNVDQITGNGDNLTGIASAAVEVVEPGSPGVTEQWSVAIYGATGGTFPLIFRSKSVDPWFTYGANAATVQAGLEDIPAIGTGGVTVTGAGSVGSPYIITMTDSWEGLDLRQLTSDVSGLTGSNYPVFSFTTVAESAGPWHWNDPLNWQNRDNMEFRVPQNGDVLYFERGDQYHCLCYDLDQSALTVTEMHIEAGFTNNAIIGLPRWNKAGYWEYRKTELEINISNETVKIGYGVGSGSPLINLYTRTSLVTIDVKTSGSPVGGEKAAVQWRGTNANNQLNILGGSVAAAPYAGHVATVHDITQRAGSLFIGHDVTLTNIEKTGGVLVLDRVSASGLHNVQG